MAKKSPGPGRVLQAGPGLEMPGKHHFMSVILMVCTCPLLVVNRQK